MAENVARSFAAKVNEKEKYRNVDLMRKEINGRKRNTNNTAGSFAAEIPGKQERDVDLIRKGISIMNEKINAPKRNTNSTAQSFNPEVPGKHERDVHVPRKGLSVINGDINARKRNTNNLKQSFKCQKQDNFCINPYLSDAQKFKIFEDTSEFNAQKFKIFEDTSESKVFNDENSYPAPSTEPCPSSPECVAASPNLNKEPLFSYSKKKSEKVHSDLIWNTPYRHDIHTYLKEVEQNFRPKPNYMSKQTDISMKMRSVLVDWFIEVVEEYKMQTETLHLAVSYVDRFLSHMSVIRGKLQLVGTASMFLASKFEEIYPPELKDFVFITDNTFTKKQVLRMEHLILKTLNFDISVPTALSFQQLYCSMCNASESVIYLSQYFCELSLVYGDPFLKFRPSIIAAGSIALANYTLGFNMWDENIAENSGYQLSDLTHVILCLYNTYSGMRGSAYQAACEKYKKNKFGCIANVHCPPKLVFPDKSSKKLCYL